MFIILPQERLKRRYARWHAPQPRGVGLDIGEFLARTLRTLFPGQPPLVAKQDHAGPRLPASLVRIKGQQPNCWSPEYIV